MYLNSLSGCELVVLASYLSVLISKNLTSDEIDILGNFFSALGSNLSTIGSSSANND